jgi:ATP-binding cassette subfamily B protein
VKRFLVPEVVQTSAMDCGPACLKALLEGHGIPASYGRLREACHTDVDGTSIDTIETVAGELGLDARQVMVPVDHLLLREAALLPALVVVRQPNGMTHFVVAWRVSAGLVQVMDPATGRRWTSRREFERETHVHEMPIPIEAWIEWSRSDDFLGSLSRRLADLGVGARRAARMIEEAKAREGWRPLAALDAATRMVATVVRGGGLRRGAEAGRALEAFAERARDASVAPTSVLPAECWTVRPGKADDGTLVLRGAVLVSIAGLAPDANAAERRERLAASSPDLAAALAEKPARPGFELLAMLRADGLLAPAVLALLLAISAGAVLAEAVIFRSLFGLSSSIALPEQRLGAIAALGIFVALLLGLELPVARRALAIGRRLELRLRVALLERMSRLDDRYFKSRLVSDMAERAHRLHELRALPDLGAELLRSLFGILFTTAGIVALAPSSAPLAIACAAAAILVPWMAQPALAEGDLRLRNHAGALLRFHLDALLGIVPLRAHAAARSVRRGHDALVGEWTRAGLRLQRRVVLVEGIQTTLCFAFAAWLLFHEVSAHGAAGSSGVGARTAAHGAGSALLLAYWVLALPVFGQQVGLVARQYPAQRSITLRFLELLGAVGEAKERAMQGSIERAPERTSKTAETARELPTGPVSIRMETVAVKAGGHTILDGVDLDIAAGSHVAIVGPSGAGKSSLVGLLLGWHAPSSGRVTIDGEPLDAARLERLRAETAWVDPSVQLWNKSLFDNLVYGLDGESPRSPSEPLEIGPTIERAGLGPVLDRLPSGLQSRLGEGGALVSGGEGQRVRLARASLRAEPRLAVLDEPLRGLARDQRSELLAAMRERWKRATVLCVTHDVGETLGFDRVLVVEGGKVVEDGQPRVLAEGPSRYATMLAAEKAVRAGLWSGPGWKRLRLDGGRLVATNGASPR